MNNHWKNEAAAEADRHGLFPLLIVLVAIIGRLPSLGAYWNQDDWRFLAAADGLSHAGWLQARLLSQTVYWQLLYPLFGFATQPWAWTRLLLHAGGALLVYRIARRSGLSAIGAGVAGLLFAATPLAFTPLYWASGVQELLGAALGLLAIDQYLRGGRSGLLMAALATIAAALAKENALLLPLLFAGLAVAGPRIERPGRLLFSALLLAVAIGEGLLVLEHFPHGDGLAYDIGSITALLMNLTQYGWWMASPWPVYSSGFHFLSGVGGLLIWTLWGVLAWRFWRSGQAAGRLPAAAACGALLSLAPALLLDTRVSPHLGYAAFAGLALSLGYLAERSRLRRSLSMSPLMPLLLAALMAALVWSGMEYRLSRRDASGAPQDPLVLRTSLSNESLRMLRAMPASASARVAILQVPEKDAAFNAGIPYPTALFTALGGAYGPALAGHPDMQVVWTHNVFSQHFSSIILADASSIEGVSPRLRNWGMANRAYIYLALNHIGEGRFAEARNALVFGMSNAEKRISFTFDSQQLMVPIERVTERAQEFLDLIPTTDLPTEQRDALLETSRELLRTCGILPSITGG